MGIQVTNSGGKNGWRAIVSALPGGSDFGRLRFAGEGWKIRRAQRFFAELGIEYRHVDGTRFSWESFDRDQSLALPPFVSDLELLTC